MYNSDFKIPIPAVDLQQAITDIIESIAMEEAALGKILAAEGEILIKAKKDSGEMQEFVCVNESVNSLVRNISMLQQLLQYELDDAKKLLQQAEDLSDYDELEE
jgi:hypothetical protein